jgi:hypothetical protein
MNRKRSGFSLVLSLAIMAGMVMLVIILAAFLQVETRLALSHSGYMRARLNAVASAKMALGQLQQLAGPDQRVTMRADMYDAGNTPGAQSSTTVTTSENPSAPAGGQLSHQKRYWTGVWATGGVSQNRVRDWNVAKPHETRLFLGWLTSPGVISSEDSEIAEYKTKPLPNNMPYGSSMYNNNSSPYPPPTSIVDTTGKALIDDLGNPLSITPDTVLVPLLSRGSVKMTTNTPTRWAVQYSGAVDAMPMPLPGPNSGAAGVKYGVNGRYAFWVGDEGVKAKANLPDVYGITSGGSGYTTALSPWDEGFRGSGAQRSALEAILPADKKDYTGATILTNAWKFSTWRDADIATSSSWDVSKMSRVKSPNDLSVWANTVSGTAAGDAMRDAAKILWHDVTPWSYSTITDTYNGGVKIDLSTAFELPYAVYRGLETYYGQKKSTELAYNRAPSLFHDASNRSAAPGTPYGYDIDYNRYGFYNISSFKIGSLEHIGSPAQVLANYPRAGEWASFYLGSTVLGSAYTSLKTQNGGEEPERVGFVYEVPLVKNFWDGASARNNPFSNDTNKTSTDNLNGRIERGPTWDLYRNYYRLYKKEIEACTALQTILGQPAVASGAMFARGVDPINFANGYVNTNSGSNPNRAPYGFLESESSSTTNSSYNYMYRYSNYGSTQGAQYDFHMGNTEKKSYGNKSPPITWPTSMKITPSVIRFALMYSVVWNENKLGIAIDPFIVVHNPYDIAIEFAGISMVTSEKEATHIFDFYYNNILIGDVFTAQSFESNHQISFRAIAGNKGTTFGGGIGATNSAVFRLEPGEVRLIGATADANPPAIDSFRSIDIPCDFVYTEGSQYFVPLNAYTNIAYNKTGGFNDNLGSKVTLPPTTAMTSADDATWAAIYSNTSNKPFTKVLWAVQNSVLKGWNGTVGDFNSKVGIDARIVVKPRNEGNLQFRAPTMGNYFYFPDQLTPGNYSTYPRGSGHIVDGGNQDFYFYLQHQFNARGQELNKFRHWMGPIQYSDENTSSSLAQNSKSAITNSFCVNEPLIMELRAMTTGWPLYGNANKGYLPAKDPNDIDAEYGAENGFNESYASMADPFGVSIPIARTLPEAFNYTGSSIPTPWREIQRWPGTDFLNAKNNYFIVDFFVRGATETSSIGAAPYYTTYPGTDSSKWPNNLSAPDEMVPAPMSPYFISTRPQQASFWGYDGKAHAPLGWICRQSPVGAGIGGIFDKKISIGKDRNQSYWGKSIQATGNSEVILFPIPRRPLLSISQLGAAGTAQFGTDPDLTVGASFANPGIKDLSKIVDWPGTKAVTSSTDPAIPEHGYVVKVTSGDSNYGATIRKMAAVRTDAAFAANLALWDSYWFSGLNVTGSDRITGVGVKSYADGTNMWPTGPNLPTDSAILSAQATALGLNGVTDLNTLNGIKAALDKGFNPLANKRVAYRPDPSVPSMAAASTVGMQNTIFPDYLTFPHPTFLGRRSLYDGGFNVNSTSKAAWKAILASLRKQKLPEGSSAADGTPLTRFARAFSGNDGKNKPWSNYRELTDDEVDELATAVVNEVRKRGPFMSLSDFINRRLVNDDNFGLKGALQAAIDATTINDSAISNGGGTFATSKGVALSAPYSPIPANDRFPSIRSMSKTNKETEVTAALGAPGIVTQMDVLNSIGPNLTARSDTFVIRAYGEAFDNNGQSIGKAWVEVVAQRSTDFIALANEEPNIRSQFYRNNDGTANSDYETKPTIDRYKRNTSTNVTKNQLINLNRILGRRFNTVSLRWLNPQEI